MTCAIRQPTSMAIWIWTAAAEDRFEYHSLHIRNDKRGGLHQQRCERSTEARLLKEILQH